MNREASNIMKKDKSHRIDTTGGESFGTSLFGSEAIIDLPLSKPSQTADVKGNPAVPEKLKPVGGRLDVKREKAGRAGKTVTVIYGFPGMGRSQREELLALLKKRFATGGTIRDGNIELQGDFADEVVTCLAEKGYRAIRAGG
jgi:translation initiation factor 1